MGKHFWTSTRKEMSLVHFYDPSWTKADGKIGPWVFFPSFFLYIILTGAQKNPPFLKETISAQLMCFNMKHFDKLFS